MFQIFSLTLKRMFKLRHILVYFLIFTPIIIIVSVINRFSNTNNNLSLNVTMNQFIDTYMVLAFIWFCGIPVILSLTGHGAGLFAAEEEEGTLGLLVMKPISRIGITAGKILGLITGQIIYLLSSIVIGTEIMFLIMDVDPDVVNSLMLIIPSIIFYGIFVIIFFTSIICALAVIFKKKVPTVIIVLGILAMVFLVLPLIRTLLTFSGQNSLTFLDFVDVNFHMGLIYRAITGAGTRIQGSSGLQSIMSFITGTFQTAVADPDLIQPSIHSNNFNVFSMAIKGNLLISTIVITGYSAIAAVLYFFTFAFMKKKDIN